MFIKKTRIKLNGSNHLLLSHRIKSLRQIHSPMSHFRLNECSKSPYVNIFRMDFCTCLCWLEKINVDFENPMWKSLSSTCTLITHVTLLESNETFCQIYAWLQIKVDSTHYL